MSLYSHWTLSCLVHFAFCKGLDSPDLYVAFVYKSCMCYLLSESVLVAKAIVPPLQL